MYNVSDEFKNSCNSTTIDSDFLIYVKTMDGSDVCTLDSTHVISDSIVIRRSSVSGSSFSLGSACTSELKLTLTRKGVKELKSNHGLKKNTVFNIVQWNRVDENQSDDTPIYNRDGQLNSTGKCNLGYFYLRESKDSDYDCDLKLYDGMIFFDRKVPTDLVKELQENGVTVETAINGILSYLSNDVGYQFSFKDESTYHTTFANKVKLTKDENISSYRDLLEDLAMRLVGFFTFSRDNKLVFRNYNNYKSTEGVSDEYIFDYDIGESSSIKGIKSSVAGYNYKNGGKEFLSISESKTMRGIQKAIDNRLKVLNSTISNYLDEMYLKVVTNLQGVSEQSYTLNQRPYLELGDVIRVNRKYVQTSGEDTTVSEVTEICIMDITYRFASGVSISSYGLGNGRVSSTKNMYVSKVTNKDRDERVDKLIYDTTGYDDDTTITEIGKEEESSLNITSYVFNDTANLLDESYIETKDYTIDNVVYHKENLISDTYATFELPDNSSSNNPNDISGGDFTVISASAYDTNGNEVRVCLPVYKRPSCRITFDKESTEVVRINSLPGKGIVNSLLNDVTFNNVVLYNSEDNKNNNTSKYYYQTYSEKNAMNTFISDDLKSLTLVVYQKHTDKISGQYANGDKFDSDHSTEGRLKCTFNLSNYINVQYDDVTGDGGHYEVELKCFNGGTNFKDKLVSIHPILNEGNVVGYEIIPTGLGTITISNVVKIEDLTVVEHSGVIYEARMLQAFSVNAKRVYSTSLRHETVNSISADSIRVDRYYTIGGNENLKKFDYEISAFKYKEVTTQEKIDITKTTEKINEGYKNASNAIEIARSNKNKIASISSDIISINSTIRGIKGSVSNVESKTDSNSGAIETLNAQYSATSSSISEIKNAISSLESSISTTDTNVSSLSTKVYTVESNVNSLDTNVSSLSTKLDTIESNVNSLGTNVSSLSNSVESLNTRVTALESQGGGGSGGDSGGGSEGGSEGETSSSSFGVSCKRNESMIESTDTDIELLHGYISGVSNKSIFLYLEVYFYLDGTGDSGMLKLTYNGEEVEYFGYYNDLSTRGAHLLTRSEIVTPTTDNKIEYSVSLVTSVSGVTKRLKAGCASIKVIGDNVVIYDYSGPQSNAISIEESVSGVSAHRNVVGIEDSISSTK